MAKYYTYVQRKERAGWRKRKVYVMADSIEHAIFLFNDKNIYAPYERIYEV